MNVFCPKINRDYFHVCVFKFKRGIFQYKNIFLNSSSKVG